MKKYVTLAALLAAGTTFANAAEAESLTLPANTDYTWIAGSNASGIGTGATAEIVQKLATAIGDDLTGWFAGTGQAYGANDYGADVSIISDSSFSFKCRPALSGEYVALGVTLTEAADSITLSFDTTNKLGYSLWSYDKEKDTATELVALTYKGEAGSVSQIKTAEIAANSQIFAIWTANHPSGNAGGGQTVTVSNIGLTYTVPEPSAFGMLAGLGALALVASRRRRK